MDIHIIGSVFTKRNVFGDFNYMIKSQDYNDSLFIFNDNEEYHETNIKGGGNAIIRKYNKYNPNIVLVRSAGIPTGTLNHGGYEEFNDTVKQTIDNTINEIKELLQTNNYKYVYYSSKDNGLLGTSIFEVDKTVLEYITSEIHKLSTNPIFVKKQISF